MTLPGITVPNEPAEPAAPTVADAPKATVKISAASHFGASNAREFSSWAPGAGSPDADVLPDLDTLRSRNRDLARNSGVASGAVQTTVDNVVGIGPRLSSTPDFRSLGRDIEWAHEWSTTVESLFREWWESRECDVTGLCDGQGLTEQVFRAGLLNGEALALPLWMPRERAKWATQIQLVESDRLSTPNGRMDSERLRGGVETDEFGRPIAYHIQKTHPGDQYFAIGGSLFSWERIPAETEWGRRRVIHVHARERTGQSRGKPYFSAVIGEMKMLDHYQRTELQAAVVNAMVAAFLETPLDGTAVAEMLGSDATDPKFQAYLQTQRELTAPLRGAAILPVMPGSTIKPWIPSRPNAAFDGFMTSLERRIGVGLGLPLELLLKDFSKTNYSSARAALMEAWRHFHGRRKWLTSNWLAPVYELWLEESVNSGLIEAPDFYTNRFAYSRAKWIWPGRGWIDPVKEAQAAQLRMDSGVSTLEMECAEQGLDWEEVLMQQARELQVRRDLGLPGRANYQAPATAPNQQEEEQPQQ